jgi:TATA-binding protein-associated factor Taf7
MDNKDYMNKSRQTGTALTARKQAREELKKVKMTPEQKQESMKQSDITGKRIEEALRAQEKAASIPDDIADQLQTSRNERAAKAYDKRRSEGEDYKKGGMVKSKSSASARADGIAVRGKTRGSIC